MTLCLSSISFKPLYQHASSLSSRGCVTGTGKREDEKRVRTREAADARTDAYVSIRQHTSAYERLAGSRVRTREAADAHTRTKEYAY
jgi:hypothetical protein